MPSAVVAITGASGARYGVRLVEQLSLAGWEIDLIISKAGKINLKLECGIGAAELDEVEGVSIHNNANLAAIPAAGSALYDAYVICPASGTTIGKIGAGISDNLSTSSALVAIKQRRKLIIVPRETPSPTPHLEAMAKMSSWGVVILPANPGFYNSPESIDDLIDFVVARILDQMGVSHTLGRRWTGDEATLE